VTRWPAGFYAVLTCVIDLSWKSAKFILCFVQTDALTLQLASARNYAAPSQAGRESAKVMQFLIEHYARQKNYFPAKRHELQDF